MIHPKRTREHQRKSEKRGIDNISETYIKSLLCSHGSNLCRSDITLEMVEEKRKQIRLYRFVRDFERRILCQA